jgi:hypothetical protein
MTSKHTPGPWRASKVRTLTDRDAYVDRVSDPHIGALDLICDNARLCDARLIAAAPELYAALVRLLARPGINGQCGDDEIAARAALAKVEG